MVVDLPADTPLAGYGGFPRRAWVPDLLGRAPDTFWFRPSTGVHDPIKVRALVLEAGGVRLLWLALDLVGMDPRSCPTCAAISISSAAARRSSRPPHIPPQRLRRSNLFALLALDRESPRVRGRIYAAMEDAARQAERRKRPATVGSGRSTVPGLTASRVREAVDDELGVLRVMGTDNRPVAVMWNYAIHGTALGRENFQLSGDVMGDASARIEEQLGVPALFVNGAVGDVSPQQRGWDGVAAGGKTLSSAVVSLWPRIKPDPDQRLAATSVTALLPPPGVELSNCLGRWIPRGTRLGLRAALPSAAEVWVAAVGRGAWVAIPG
jgi:hypothetical protein